MIALITAGLVAVGLLLQIIVWIGSYKRKDEKRRREIYAELKKVEHELAKALHTADTVNISRLANRLAELRKEYDHLSRR